MTRIFCVLVLSTQLCYSTVPFWSKTGHRVTGEIAERHLSKKAKKWVYKLLKGQSLAEVSNYADDIKSDPQYNEYYPWHYVNYPGDKEYSEVEHAPEGDIVVAIQKCIQVLESETSSEQDQIFYLKMLVHLIGDLHQPMHVGRKEDRGGNDIQVQWFDEGSNLHRVWDKNMIHDYGMSYTELANKLPDLSKRQIREIQKGDVLVWVEETQEITNEVYNSVEVGGQLGYAYSYKYWPIVEQQLLTGGLRLAAIINEIAK